MRQGLVSEEEQQFKHPLVCSLLINHYRRSKAHRCPSNKQYTFWIYLLIIKPHSRHVNALHIYADFKRFLLAVWK